MQCYDEDHTFYIAVVGVPCFIFYVLGIPGTALLLMWRNRKKIEGGDKRAIFKFGFLFSGYKKKYYYCPS